MTHKLQAENVSDETMQQLAAANGRMVTYKGFLALLHLDTSICPETNEPRNTVELEFDSSKSHRLAEGDFSILADLPFRTLDPIS
jgi:hypothetical protein